MSENNVVFLSNGRTEVDAPDEEVIEFLEELLKLAKSGEAQNIVAVWRNGTGDQSATSSRWAAMTAGQMGNSIMAMELVKQEMLAAAYTPD